MDEPITMSKKDLALNKSVYRQLEQLKGVVADHQFNDAAMPAMVVIQLEETAERIAKNVDNRKRLRGNDPAGRDSNRPTPIAGKG